MKIAGRHSFSKGRQEIWKALQDPQTLSVTLPGVRRLEVVGPDRYTLAAQVGIGSVKGLFEGTFGVEDKKDFESCVLRGSARGASGSADVEAMVRLLDGDGGGTLLDYDASASVTGPIAGVGQRMIAAASKRMAAQFFAAIEAYDGTAPGLASGAEVTPGQVFERPVAPRDSRTFVRGVIVGFALAVAGVAVGRWSAKGR